ncbi:MAG: DUF5050 domain-containing protein [Chitinophagaceae bacterium]|nr:DUF5050 domain-containing protein [Chitinophagaceae bacterium]
MKKLFLFFLVSLIALVGCKKSHYNLDDLPPTVKGFFTVSQTGFDVDEGIQFTNASENADSYSWDFGDGTKSTEKDPVKTYTASGIFTVTLKAVGPGGTGTFSRDITIIDPNENTGSDKELYFIEHDTKAIRKVSLEPGASVELVADISGKRGVGLAYDPVDKKIYFSDFEDTDNGKIWRMDEDGSNMETLVSGITDPYSIAINLSAGKIYWADDDGNISRANLDGSSLESEFIHIDGGLMRGIAYDSKNDIIYFYEVDEEVLYAAKSDGTGVAKIIEDAFGYSIFVDEVNGKLYYEDRNEPAIMQANLDGSGIVKIADVPGTRIHGMAIDYDAGKFYWADRSNGVIRRCNLDGSGAEPFLSGLGSPRGIFIK